MIATFTVYCPCTWPLHKLQSGYLTCENPDCEHFGKEYEAPTVELKPKNANPNPPKRRK